MGQSKMVPAPEVKSKAASNSEAALFSGSLIGLISRVLREIRIYIEVNLRLGYGPTEIMFLDKCPRA